MWRDAEPILKQHIISCIILFSSVSKTVPFHWGPFEAEHTKRHQNPFLNPHTVCQTFPSFLYGQLPLSGLRPRRKYPAVPHLLYQEIHPYKGQFSVAYTKALVQTLSQLKSFFYWLIHKRSNMSSFSAPCMSPFPSKNILAILNQISPVFVDDRRITSTNYFRIT